MPKNKKDDFHRDTLTNRELQEIRMGDPETALIGLNPTKKVMDGKHQGITEAQINDLVNQVGSA